MESADTDSNESLANESLAQTAVPDEGQSEVLPRLTSPQTAPDSRRDENSRSVLQNRDSTRLAFVPVFVDDGVPTQPPAILYSSEKAKTFGEVAAMFSASRNYVGPSAPGVSRSRMRRRFRRKLRKRVSELAVKSRGGIIEEFGELDRRQAHVCTTKPALQLSDVRRLARKSFGIPDFEVSYPPCSGVAKRTSCSYETGKCCTRPQTEFIARYYDTAVAAMALGATRDEAFAPLLHARILAYTLQSCDPKLSVNGWTAANTFTYARSDSPSGYSEWAPFQLGLISFPVAYEVLYELYNTMLIERMRSRGRKRLPTDKEMRALNDAVYYKKMIARLAPLDRDLNPKAVFPDSGDFRAAGLTMATSRMAKSSDTAVENPNESEVHPSLRVTKASVSLYETSSHRWRTMSYSGCNANLSDNPYYPYRFQKSVWSRFQGCCAKECSFMARYGQTFSAGSANCCSGCNRYSCEANGLDVATYLAGISSVETSSKINVGAEEVTFCV